jgi:hypothetical protein
MENAGFKRAFVEGLQSGGVFVFNDHVNDHTVYVGNHD